jgi:geranylgeranyl pyrophosphate synthase
MAILGRSGTSEAPESAADEQGAHADPDSAAAAGIGVIVQRGGEMLAQRMASIESHLELVSGRAGTPLGVHAHATIAAGGKRLRPLLVVLAAESAGGPQLTPQGEGALVRAAAAVELVHSATLVHDDVIDAAQLRRGRPTVVQEAGREAAVGTGDLLFSRAFAELACNGDVLQLRALSDASSSLANGELLQREDAYAAEVPVERYMLRCELKTAALFEAACRLGALVAVEGSAALADALGAFARRIGLAFQLLDDVLDVCGPVERTGKPRGTDLLDGTVTLPLILARQRDARLAGEDLSRLRGAGEAEALCDRIAATGALEDARKHAFAIVAEAKGSLPEFLPDGRSALLDLVADAVVERFS